MKTKYLIAVVVILNLVACGDPGLPDRELDTKARVDTNQIPEAHKESNRNKK